MPKPDTKSAALSRLFGNKPGSDGAGERPEDDQAVPKKGRKATPKGEKKNSSSTPSRTRGAKSQNDSREKTSAVPAKETSKTKRRQKPKQTAGNTDAVPQNTTSNQKNTTQEHLAPPEPVEEAQTGEESGYIGSGRYRRTTGVLERISPYIRPDQAEALRVAVALRNDPRGSDISAIIQSLLDEAGYHGEES